MMKKREQLARLRVPFEHLHPELQACVKGLLEARKARLVGGMAAGGGITVGAHFPARELFWPAVIGAGAGYVAIQSFKMNEHVKKFTMLVGERLVFGQVIHPLLRVAQPKLYAHDEELRKKFEYAFVRRDGGVEFSNEKPKVFFGKQVGRMRIPIRRMAEIKEDLETFVRMVGAASKSKRKIMG